MCHCSIRRVYRNPAACLFTSEGLLAHPVNEVDQKPDITDMHTHKQVSYIDIVEFRVEMRVSHHTPSQGPDRRKHSRQK